MSTQITGLTELTTTSDNDLILVREASTGFDKRMRAVNLRAKATTKDDVGLSNVTNDQQLKRASNLSDLASTATARTNLGLGTAAVQDDTRYNHRSNNLSDVGNAATARTNLGLGTAAVQPDTRYAHRANNLSDLGSAATARTNLGLGTAATQADTRYAHRTNNLSDLSSAATARTNLGLGTAATQADTKYAHRANNLNDIANAATARTNLGLGTISTQNTNAVAVTGGTINSVSVGATTASSGRFTSLEYSATFTGGTGIVNIGSGQFYKDATGKIGIGTTSPDKELTVIGDIFAEKTSGVEVDIAARGFGVGPTMHGYRANGTKASPTRTTVGQLVYGIGCRPHTGSGFVSTSTAAIHFVARQDVTTANQGAAIRFLITPNGSTSANRKEAFSLECDAAADGPRFRAKAFGALRERFYFQGFESEGPGTSFGILPASATNGNRFGQLNVFSERDPTNSEYLALKAAPGLVEILSGPTGTAGSPPLAISTANVERMRITSTGDVGIGTQTPARKLHINDTMRLQPRSTAPGSPSEGDIYFDSVLKKLRCYDGIAWRDCF